MNSVADSVLYTLKYCVDCDKCALNCLFSFSLLELSSKYGKNHQILSVETVAYACSFEKFMVLQTVPYLYIFSSAVSNQKVDEPRDCYEEESEDEC